MTNRKLPIGIQSFEDIRTQQYIYVDKTWYIWNLAENGKVYFLSRPRRFGKSLLISTMEAYFQGKQELFSGLAIEALEQQKGTKAWQVYPVIRFSLSGGDYNSSEGLQKTLSVILAQYEIKYGVDAADYDLPNRFRLLIETAFEKSGQKVVVLVDEYDKPLLETMTVNELQEDRNRSLYKSFFSVLKDEDQYLKFAFFTGVTKFSKVSVFSDLNQLNDISMVDEADKICGISEEELRYNFAPEIKAMAEKWNIPEEKCLIKLAQMYDGYHFSAGAEGVYNPFSLLNALQKRDFGSYWFESGTPTFLIKKLRESDFTPEEFNDGVEISEMALLDYRNDNPNPIPLFYQSGYLTIRNFDRDFRIYDLTFPNDEVKYGFLNSLAPYVLGVKDTERPLSVRNMILDLQDGKADDFLKQLVSLFAAIPYVEGKVPSYEQEWRNEIFLIFMLMGQHVSCEVHSATGRADCVVKTQKYIYIFEFKLDKTADEALQQIEQKNYALPYREDLRKIIKIGVNFSTQKRNIESWEIVTQ